MPTRRRGKPAPPTSRSTRRCSVSIAEHGALSASEATLERETDLLRHQVSEIESATLQAGEEEATLARYLPWPRTAAGLPKCPQASSSGLGG